MIFCRNRDRSLTIFCEERTFADALSRASGGLLSESLGELLAARRRESRRGWWIAASLALGIAALLVAGFWGVRVAARAAVHAMPVALDEKIGELALKSMDLGGPEVHDAGRRAASDRRSAARTPPSPGSSSGSAWSTRDRQRLCPARRADRGLYRLIGKAAGAKRWRGDRARNGPRHRAARPGADRRFGGHRHRRQISSATRRGWWLSPRSCSPWRRSTATAAGRRWPPTRRRSACSMPRGSTRRGWPGFEVLDREQGDLPAPSRGSAPIRRTRRESPRSRRSPRRSRPINRSPSIGPRCGGGRQAAAKWNSRNTNGPAGADAVGDR